MKSFPWTSVSCTYTINCGWRNPYWVQINEIAGWEKINKSKDLIHNYLLFLTSAIWNLPLTSLSTHFSLSKFHYLTFVGQWNKLFFRYVKINLTIMFQPANFKATGFQGWVRTRHVVSRTHCLIFPNVGYVGIQATVTVSRIAWTVCFTDASLLPGWGITGDETGTGPCCFSLKTSMSAIYFLNLACECRGINHLHCSH